jgi:hypothetical protein
MNKNVNNALKLEYGKYEYTPILGWSVSRYEQFEKCRRQYFYSYYHKYVREVPLYKMTQLRDLTSVPLEIGNVIHDVIEAFLKRLQKNDNNIDEKRFYEYARQKTDEYFSTKTFIETYYGYIDTIDMEAVSGKIKTCLDNFMNSPCYNWIFMKAIVNRENWMIEPEGYGETRLDGMKAYCKMDFLLPVQDEVHILDWKTGKKDPAKHSGQIIGYAAAASANFGVPRDRIFPKIVYLYPAFDELELRITDEDFTGFIGSVRAQTQMMYSYCSDKDKNIPLSIDKFEKMPSPTLCRQCRFQELCFPNKRIDIE